MQTTDTGFSVDPDELAAHLPPLRDVVAAMTSVRVQLREVMATLPEWGADGGVARAADALVATLDEAARRGQVEAATLADQLWLAGGRYAAAEEAATAPSGGR